MPVTAVTSTGQNHVEGISYDFIMILTTKIAQSLLSCPHLHAGEKSDKVDPSRNPSSMFLKNQDKQRLILKSTWKQEKM